MNFAAFCDKQDEVSRAIAGDALPPVATPPPMPEGVPVVHWNPFYGCTPISPGCASCPNPPVYAAALGDDTDGSLIKNAGRTWTGVLKRNPIEAGKPLSLTKPSDVSVCPLGDLFHESAPDAWLDEVFEVIAKCPQHVFRILTKRVERMQKYCAARFGETPPENIVFCAVAERQIEADLRVPHLMKMKGYHRFVMFFPLMSRIDMFAIPGVNREDLAQLSHVQSGKAGSPRWLEQLARDCKVIGVPFIDSLFCLNAGQYAQPLVAVRLAKAG